MGTFDPIPDLVHYALHWQVIPSTICTLNLWQRILLFYDGRKYYWFNFGIHDDLESCTILPVYKLHHSDLLINTWYRQCHLFARIVGFEKLN